MKYPVAPLSGISLFKYGKSWKFSGCFIKNPGSYE
ncbi:hypothetical protein RUMOBE_03036 [Blautia obeum ATCC 29174]|uniref:Uncharacterized protein n=1 Tax=Blautia obeum ATCC 29174 TaxID=411459 RepID=A5ZVK0_9FIRM|nr:hypothetical protein RUMOBE_03036 [Blautia obeum ATCC 29174]